MGGQGARRAEAPNDWYRKSMTCVAADQPEFSRMAGMYGEMLKGCWVPGASAGPGYQGATKPSNGSAGGGNVCR